jgi:hypothetical protein
MKSLLKIEELIMALVAIYFLHLHNLGLPTWLWILLFFSPDIGMLGYLVSNKIGAITYNLFHHKGIALLIALIAYFVKIEVIMAVGILLFAHSCFDRIWGYGLKYFSNFKDTHLGNLGINNSPDGNVSV